MAMKYQPRLSGALAVRATDYIHKHRLRFALFGAATIALRSRRGNDRTRTVRRGIVRDSDDRLDPIPL
jgi:hypothetical protein